MVDEDGLMPWIIKQTEVVRREVSNMDTAVELNNQTFSSVKIIQGQNVQYR